jgi:hypothetical protein
MYLAQGKEFIGLRSGRKTNWEANGSRESEEGAEDRATIV